jgi:nitrate reductase NapD
MKRDRRQFIRGRWVVQRATLPSPDGTVEIASILVQTRPERLATVETAIRLIGGTEIFQHDPKGKIVVVVEAANGEAVGQTLTHISLLPDVITATLVYHAVDTGDSGNQDVAS